MLERYDDQVLAGILGFNPDTGQSTEQFSLDSLRIDLRPEEFRKKPFLEQTLIETVGFDPKTGKSYQPPGSAPKVNP